MPLPRIVLKLDFGLDYARIAEVLANAGYRGYVSLEFEGQDDILPGIQKSPAELRKHFGTAHTSPQP